MSLEPKKEDAQLLRVEAKIRGKPDLAGYCEEAPAHLVTVMGPPSGVCGVYWS